MTESAIADLQLSGDFAAGSPARIELFELLDGFCRDESRRDRLFLRGHDQSKIDRGIHGLASFDGFPTTIEGPSLDTFNKLALLAFRKVTIKA
jgi:hypothetical protein